MRSPSDCHLRPLITDEAEAPQSIRIAGKKIRNSEIERRSEILIRTKRGVDHTGGLRESGGDEGEHGEEEDAEMGHGGGDGC